MFVKCSLQDAGPDNSRKLHHLTRVPIEFLAYFMDACVEEERSCLTLVSCDAAEVRPNR